MQHGAGAPGHADVPGFEHLEGHNRGVGQVPQFVSQEAETLAPARGFAIDGELMACASVFGDGARDGVVKAAVERAKVLRADRRVHLQRQLGDCLTDIAIIVHDL